MKSGSDAPSAVSSKRHGTFSALLAEGNSYHYVLLSALLVALLTLPSWLPGYYTAIAVRILLFGVIALSFNLQYGHLGMLPFGHIGFFAVGAYSMAVYAKAVSDPSLLVGTVIALMITVPSAFLLGRISLHLRGLFFALVTLAFSQFLFFLLLQARSVTGGDDGITGIPSPTLLPSGGESFGVHLGSTVSYYYISLVLIVAVLVGLFVLMASPLGRAIHAVRDNDIRASFTGANTFAVRLTVFVVSSSVAAIAGAVYAPFRGSVVPGITDWVAAADPIFMVLIGGSASIIGPAVGAVVFIVVKQIAVDIWLEGLLLVYGVGILLIVLLLPQGILPSLRRRLSDGYASRTAQSSVASTDSGDLAEPQQHLEVGGE